MGWHWRQFYGESTTQMHSPSSLVVVVVGQESVLCLSLLFGRVWYCGCSLPFHTPFVPPPPLLLPPSVLLGRRSPSRSMPVHKYE